MVTALVTGGTSGIGAQFAHKLAARGYDLVLIARDADRLQSMADGLRAANGISVETIRADLLSQEDVDRVIERIEDPQRPIEFVVNNAGHGVSARLLAEDSTEHDRAFALMCTAVFALSVASARVMVRRGSGTVLNVSSLQGFLTTGSYSAIKAWLTSFTQSLAVELRGTGVNVTVLLPGWVATEWHRRAGVGTSSIPDWLWTDPEFVARSALRSVDRGRVICIPMVRYRVIAWVIRHLPLITVRWLSRRITTRRRAQQNGAEDGLHKGTKVDGQR